MPANPVRLTNPISVYKARRHGDDHGWLSKAFKCAFLRPSTRRELESTSVNTGYVFGAFSVQTLGRGHAWLDTGTHDAWLEAAEQFGQFITGRLFKSISMSPEVKWPSNESEYHKFLRSRPDKTVAQGYSNVIISI
jgi:dTDP-glucose pyrophosphorylase